VGSNRRYAAHYDARLDQLIGERLMREGQPVSLEPAQLELDRWPLTRLPISEACAAWVFYEPGGWLRLDVEMVAHTPHHCAIRWLAFDDVMHRAWVWRGQVHPLRSRRTRQGS
jgi:hypothetical protein